MSAAKRKKNPLYVVTNDGQTVEKADNMFDAWVKKMGLQPLVDLINEMIQFLLSQVTNYAFFMVFKDFVDDLVEKLEALTKAIDPVLAFSIFKR